MHGVGGSATPAPVSQVGGGRLPLGLYQWLESDAPAQGLREMGWLVDQSRSSGLCCPARVVL